MSLFHKFKKTYYRGLMRDSFQIATRDSTQYLLNYANDKEGLIEFLQNKGNSTGQSRIAETKPSTTKEHKFNTVQIPINKIDNDIKAAKKNILIKLDVEGHEQQAILGMQELLKNNNCILQVEVSGGSADKVVEILNELGYQQSYQVSPDYYFSKLL